MTDMRKPSLYRLLWWSIALVIIGLGAAGGSMLLLAQRAALPSLQQHKNTTSMSSPAPASSASGPVGQLAIPAIGVNAPIESVGVTATGNMDVPHQNPWTGVGWFDQGPRLGDVGSAVLAGHLDRPGGSPAVFWDLHKLQIGSQVFTTDSQGQKSQFRVTRIAYYTPENAPIQEIFGKSGGSYLNLITCAGTWIPSQQQTTQRLVVYTVLA